MAHTRSGCFYKRGQVYWIKYYHDGRPYYENRHTDVKEQPSSSYSRARVTLPKVSRSRRR